MADRKLTNMRAPGFATRAIHYGYAPLDHQGALSAPLYLTSTFAFPSAAEGGRRFAGEAPGYIYGRLGNPTVGLLEERLASLEGGEAALATASGMGAITTAIWTLLKPGDEILTDLTLYGCTFAFFRHGLAQFGINVRHADLTDLDAVEASFTAATRLVYFETPANPNMRLVDIAAVADLAHARGALVMVDNTYCTPLLQRPLSLGADLVVHSATKYLGGHGDLLAGAAVGGKELIERMRYFGLKDMTGAVLSPFDAFLVLRGLKTLEVRMERHCRSAARIATLLEAHPAVARVHYPGLASAPQHALACRQMTGGFGGMIAFELGGGFDAGLRFMDALKLVTIAVSLGDAETLVQHPASMTHSPYTPEERAAHGITEGLVRLSIGLESVEDIEADIGEALDVARQAPLRRAG
ncbi:MAG TPA: methionine gamma-lyase [Aliidongia sp.]|uniref:methionine gamma-lyase n=1 Tax=Aliidongia sp. TaxID=1914230 RepID=UPI002DDCC3F9|nr:methionine gamma-lyase [Aliidongia sp.]HEV2676940.1 methionine gamma-lyase [Aliidongia sp.]